MMKFGEGGAERRVQDSLAQLLDVLGPGGQARQVVAIEAGALSYVAVVQAVQRRRHQSVAPLLTLGLCHLQFIAQDHEFVNLGDDAVLSSVSKVEMAMFTLPVQRHNG